MRRLLPALLLSLPLAGCAENWQRPGTTVEQADRDFARCQQAAAASIPARMERRESSPERTVYRRVCRNQGGREVCRDEYSHRVAATYENVDVNRDARMELARACMRQQGYTLDGLRAGPPTTVRP
ncbi:hypothetical protein [Falsiroseomonas oryzae]|uniref:hypothetical protein n=1 Tax=Falsiroseomonas oryzae TaxID=2766473 RepID=UPI0022EAFA00|nr:hypothetical protein [Roseomonas sp. MO-31]